MMVQDVRKTPSEQEITQQSPADHDVLFRLTVWGLWLLTIVAGGYLYWRDAANAGLAVDPIGLVMRMVLIGTVGLVVKTLFEQRFNPEQFMD